MFALSKSKKQIDKFIKRLEMIETFVKMPMVKFVNISKDERFKFIQSLYAKSKFTKGYRAAASKLFRIRVLYSGMTS